MWYSLTVKNEPIVESNMGELDKNSRVKALFDYLNEVVRLGLKVIRRVDEHQEDFLLFQNELPNVDGISLFTPSGEDLFWISVHRQNISNPPELPEILRNWVEVSNDPNKEPQIIEEQRFVDEKGDSGQDAFIEYWEIWEQWAKEAKTKKKVQDIYNKLFKVNEQLKYDEQLELIWGHGLFLWKSEKYIIKYPLITQRMVIEHNAGEGIIHVFPEDDTEPKLELDMLIDTGLPDLSDTREKFIEFLKKRDETTLKDFYPLGFCRPILKEIAGRLTPDGEFVELNENHDLNPTHKLRVIDCWILFLRKRQQDAVIRDIESFCERLKKEEIELPKGLLSFITDPKATSSKWIKKSFNEWDIILDKQVLFPLATNQEQIQILNCLEHSEGVVVKGPPGTGKSHTIANLICHFMAEGKRVLVSSQKDQALSVLHNMIPNELRPLCMSVLSNVRDSKEKLKRAVESITEIVTQSQPYALEEEIKELESKFDQIREQLEITRNDIQEISKAQFRYIKYQDEEFLPADLVKKIREEKQHTWLLDTPNYETKIEKSDKKEVVHIVTNPPLSDKEIEELILLRRHLIKYFNDLSYELPATNDLVDRATFYKMVKDLQKISELNKDIKDYVPSIVFKNESEELINQALKVLKEAIDTYELITENWQRSLLTILQKDIFEADKIKESIEKLSPQAEKLKKLYQAQDPLQTITLPETIELEELRIHVSDAIERLKKGKSIFNLFDLNRKRKKALKAIFINSKPPSSLKEWEDILNHIEFLKTLKELKYQWNNFAQIMNIPQLSESKIPEKDAKELLSLIKKLNAPYEYETAHLPKIKKILDSLILQANEILTKTPIQKIYKAINLKREQSNFQNSQNSLEQLKDNLYRIASSDRVHPVVNILIESLNDIHNPASIDKWGKVYEKVKTLESFKPDYEHFNKLLNKLATQAPHWANKWRQDDISESDVCPSHWQKSWWFKSLKKYLQDVSNGTLEIYQLEEKQNRLIDELRRTKQKLVLAKVKLSLIKNIKEAHLQALKRWHLAVKKLGKGKGKYTWQKEKIVQQEMRQAKSAVPVWIMPLYKVSETIPSEFGSFDIVIIDEASQCDIRALLALARSKKAIIVGDPEQISPDAVGIPTNEVQRLIKMYLGEIPNGEYFDLETSLYDLADIVFSSQGELMLKEHFRCVPEIIQFSNELCYDGKIMPLRNPSPSERLEPVLENAFVKGGYREGRMNINKPEAKAICERIRQMVNDPQYKGRTFGVISLLGHEQARYIFNIIGEYLTPDQQEKCKFRVGDAYAFQGDERDIILLSMVVGADDEKRLTTLTHDIKRYRQRFNVAVSRAKDKLILFHSIKLEDLKPQDLRYQLLYYIKNGVLPERKKKEEIKEKFESPFEEAVYDWLTKRGYHVIPQVKVGHYRIDLVVEGANSRLGIECDGDRWHPPEKWWDDQIRQRQLERAGWVICRIWGSDFYQNPDIAMEPILRKLSELKTHHMLSNQPKER